MFGKEKQQELKIALMFFVHQGYASDVKSVHCINGYPSFRCSWYDDEALDKLCEEYGVESHTSWNGKENSKVLVWVEPIRN